MSKPVCSDSRIDTDKRVDSKILNELINYTYADEKIDAQRNQISYPGGLTNSELDI